MFEVRLSRCVGSFDFHSCSGLLGYGGSAVLNKYGTADGWKQLLMHMVEKQAARIGADNNVVYLRYSPAGFRWAEKELKVSERALKAYGDWARM